MKFYPNTYPTILNRTYELGLVSMIVELTTGYKKLQVYSSTHFLQKKSASTEP